MGYSYLVLGATIGRAIGYFLNSKTNTSKIVIGDLDQGKAADTAKFINAFGSQRKCTAVKFDAANCDPKSLLGFNLVISALPAKHNYDIAENTIKAGVNFCDLGGVVGITEKMLGLSDMALEKGVSIVPDCGLMPGLGILIARLMVHEFQKKPETVIIYVGGLPQKPRPPLFYQKVFNIDGLEVICYDPAPVLINGETRLQPRFSNFEELNEFPLKDISPTKDGKIEAFTSAGASIAHLSFKGFGVRNFSEKTVRWPGFVDFVRNIPRSEFKIKVGPHINIPVNSENPDLVWMKIKVSSPKDDKPEVKVVSLFDTYDKGTRLSAMERCTGFPTAIMAETIASGRVQKGVLTPEIAFTPEQIRNMLQELKRHLRIKP